MKGREEWKECKWWKEVDLERSNIFGMHKRSKNKDTIILGLSVSMKATRIEKQRIKMLEPQLLSENKCLK